MIRVLVLFFISGSSGLIYQVVWVRLFGRLFGNTVHSASLVTAVFMSGLGAGSYFAGKFIDRRHRTQPNAPLKVYSGFELGIGMLGLVLALILPRLEPLAASFNFYAIEANGWQSPSPAALAMRYIFAAILLAPITFLMGGTLTLLLRHVVSRDLTHAGWRVAALYGANTLGAAVGAFLTDFALIPSFGIFSTELFAVFGNLIAAFGALQLSKAPAETIDASEPIDRREGEIGRAVLGTAIAIALSGFAAMGVEIVWFRFATCVLGGYRAVFSMLLAVILSAMWLGSMLGGWINDRVRRPVLLFYAAEALFAGTVIAFLTICDPQWASAVLSGLRDTYLAAGPSERSSIMLAHDLRIIMGIAAVPALFMGFIYPIANAHLQRAESEIGKRAGILYLGNTAGAVLGALATGFFLIPSLGMKSAVFVLGTASLASIAALAIASDRREGIGFGLAAMLIIGALIAWRVNPDDGLLRAAISSEMREDRVIDVHEGENEVVAVVENAKGERALLTDGHPMSGTSPSAQRYMRSFSHIPLLSIPDPSDVVVICFGVGSTAHAASLHPSVKRLEIVDVSRNVLEHGHYFAATNRDVLLDPRTHVFINDGRNHLWMKSPGSVDLITMEPPPIALAGVSALYSRDFYALAKSRLKANGFVTQWLPAYQVPGEVVRSILRAFLDVFPNGILLSGDRSELILMGGKAEHFVFDPDLAERKRAENPALKANLDEILLRDPIEIVGMFAAGSEALDRASRNVPPVTDDDPLTEYSETSMIYETEIPEDMFDTSTAATWCPKCFADATYGARLGDYLKVTQSLYESPVFRRFKTYSKAQTDARIRMPTGITVDSPVIRESPYLSRLFE